jgi:hypothetical protein
MLEEWKGEREVEGMRGGKSQTLRPRSFVLVVACLPAGGGENFRLFRALQFFIPAVHLANLTTASDQLIYA